MYKTLLFTLLVGLTVMQSLAAQVRNTSELQTGWKFFKGENPMAYREDFNDATWQDVRVPHDWAISGPFIPDGNASTGKLPWQGEGWYRYHLTIPASDLDKRYYLVCDGIMSSPDIYVNGQLTGKWDYGYNSFYVDISDFVRTGSNVLAIHADTRDHDSRWYPGAGIFRKVQLITLNPIHVGIWGTYITTPIIKPHYADVRVETTLHNNLPSTEDIQVQYRIYSPDKHPVAEQEVNGKLPGQKTDMLEVTLTVPNPWRWDIDSPSLYTLVTKVFRDDTLLDTCATTFGIRDIRFTADHGFYLNDRRVQLKGVNLHHDQGPLGAAFNTRAMERQLEIMKSMGCNAVRSSHNVPAPELLDLCDRMGILVFDEIFDKYDGKADITDTTDFEAFTYRNVRNFIMRDRNHPSVFIWSVGNEIGDVQWNKNNGFQKLRMMVNTVEKYDDTRATTLVCDSYGSAALRHFDYYDVHSWNYGRRYALARQLEPNKAVIISESASTLSTRGFYELPLPEAKTDFTNSLQVSSYDLNAPWWAEVADDDFMWQQEEPYIAGEFVWTGFDYLGEPTPYDNSWVKEHGMSDTMASRSSYFGAVDLCGIPKDRYYLYKSYWKQDETTVHLLPHWNWPDRVGKTVPVFVYTNGDCAELFLNGTSLGMQCKNVKSNNSIERFRLMWKDVLYQPGELKAVAYKGGTYLGESIMRTANTPYKLKLSPDRTTIRVAGDDLSYILIEAFDKHDNPCPLASNTIDISLHGPGTIAGVGNGNPQSMKPFQSNSVDLFYGKAMLIVRSDASKGSITVVATSDGLQSASSLVKVE